MPIAQTITYKCPKCGYKKTIIQGDVIYPTDGIIPLCPKCKTMMVVSNDTESLMKTIVDFFSLSKDK